MKKIILTAAIIAVAACSSPEKPSLVGSWVTPIPGQEPAVEGMELCKDGTAKSINMHTLTLSAWEQKNDTLFITATSEGSGAPFTAVDTLKIVKLTADSLILNNGGEYSRQK